MSGDARTALIGLFLLAGTALLAPVGLQIARHLTPGRRVFFARWGFTHLGLVLAAGLVASGAVRLVLREPSTLQKLYAGEVVLLAVSVAVLVVARRTEPEPWRSLGLRGEPGGPSGTARALACAAVSFFFFLPAVLGSYELWPFLHDLLWSTPWEEQQVATEIGALAGAELLQAAVIAVVVAPLLEELVFRGFLQPLLVQNLSDRGGVVVTSLLFALLHGRSVFLPVFVLSLVIGGVMLRTRRLAAAWLVHALNNACTLLVFQLAQGAPGGTP